MQDFVRSAKNVRESKNIESKVKSVQDKFSMLVRTVQQRGAFYAEVSSELEDFTVRVEAFDEWYVEMCELLESRELLTADADEAAKRVDELARRKVKNGRLKLISHTAAPAHIS